MDYQLIFGKRTGDNRAIEVYVGEYLGEAIIRRVTIDGQSVKGISSNVYSLPKPQGAATHYIPGKPPIGLTAAEAEQIIAALAALQGTLDAARAPIVAAADLRDTRRDLVARYRGLIDEQSYQFERAHDRQDAGAWHVKERHESQIADAEQAVRDFDRAHPEIIAAIRAEEAEAVERNRWM